MQARPSCGTRQILYGTPSQRDESSLCGYGNKASKIDTILSNFEKCKPKPLDYKKPKSKEERRLQAFLIKEALTNNRNLNRILKLQHFEDLLFCLDEVSIGDSKHKHLVETEGRPNIVRCDILAVGKMDGIYFPVLIELKYDRKLCRLVNQLNNFIRDVEEDHNIKNKVMELMKISAGIKEEAQFRNVFKKVIVWPKNEKARESTSKILKMNEIIQVEYEFKEARWNFTA